MHSHLHPRVLSATLTLAAVLLTGTTSRADDRMPKTPDLEVQKYILPNGLEVILHEDHTTPVVGVNIWYKVGSKNEKTGRTGFAHLFEHLMFQGSQHHDSEYFAPMEKLGANINGSTNTDRTNYFETLPSNALELALWLESDRMGFLLQALTQAKLDNQRDVVKNERRQRVDNVAGSQAGEKLDEALYPPEHPYHHSVIGSMADLSAASLNDVSGFFRTYYSPNNASLVIAGDIDVPKTKALVEKYFGPIPAGPTVAKLKPDVPVLSGPKHLKLTDKLTNPRAQLVWPTIARGDKDEQALTLLAQVLGAGGGFGGGGGPPGPGRGGRGGGGNKQSRLFLALMYNRPLAASANASGRSSDLAGTFEVTLSARPNGASLDELIKIADAEIEKLKADGPTEDELLKIKNATESRLIMSLEAASRKADFFNRYNVEYGDPLAYKKEMADLFAVTPADVKRVANKYLTANRIRVDVNPGDPAVRAPEVTVDAKTQAPVATVPTVAIKDSFDRNVEPKVGAAPKFTPPAVVRRKLSNGMDVLIVERHELPILSLELVVKGGETLVPADKHGLAALTGSLMTEGTTSRDSLKLAGELADIAASVGASGGLESSTLTLTTLNKHAAKGLKLFTDVLLHPTFPAREMNRLKMQRLNMIRSRGDRAEAVAGTVFPRLLYGDDHPYGRPDMGTAKSIEAITRDDLVAFHKRLFVPNNASLVVVGDVTPDGITATLESALKDWKAGEAVAKASLPEPPTSSKGVTVYLVNKPSAAQTVLAVGQVGLPRSTPDYVPVMVLNSVLGGQFSSRINLNLREDKGYTYGARSSFSFRQGPGPFEASAPVQTQSTKEALAELMKELTDISGPRPVTDAELAFAKDRIIRGMPSRFETTMGVAGTMTDLVLYNLPDDYFTTYPTKVEAVTKADVDRVAKTYLDPNKMTILIVGDRAKIEEPLKTLPFVKVINVLDSEGNALPASGSAGTGDGGK